jgi:hypothetical protein
MWRTRMARPSSGLSLASRWPHTGLSERELAEAERVIARHHQEIINAWHKHFGG